MSPRGPPSPDVVFELESIAAVRAVRPMMLYAFIEPFETPKGMFE